MEPNTQKGCMIGCLSSVCIFIGIIFAIGLLFLFAIRGCTQAASGTPGASGISSALDNELRPQDEKPFKKIWLSGKGAGACGMGRGTTHRRSVTSCQVNTAR